MTSKHTETPTAAQLEAAFTDGAAGALVAKKLDRLMKRQQGEIRQLQGLRWALDLLPQGAARRDLAAQILQITADHARRAQRLAQDLLNESTPAGQQ